MRVDSAYVMNRLLHQVNLREYEKMVDFTKRVRGTYYGMAFEALVHKKVGSGGVSLCVQQYYDRAAVGEYGVIEGTVISKGSTKEDCFD